MRALIAAALALLTARAASASTIVELGPAALEAGADRVVDARVIARDVQWNAAHTMLETHAVLAVEAARKGAPATTLEIVVPGGTLAGRQQIVFGTPAVIVGERARWFLAARGDGTYRVYGWAQGKWPERAGGFVRDPIAAERDPHRFAVNGMVWPAAKIPVRYLIQSTGSADLAIGDVVAAFDAAFATWQAVPTSALAFQNDGMTSLGLDSNDDTNVMLFVESDWQFGPEAAAATSLVILDGMQTADIAVNGVDFTWAIGPASASINAKVLDLQAVMTHEIDHFSGLGHSDRAFDTMYFSWSPWPGQRTLSIDDKRGLTSLYPIAGDECATSATCPPGETCEPFAEGRLCAGTPDPVGTACNYDRVECDGFCLFTATDLSAGYCSRFCTTDTDCPLTHHCDEASAGGSTVKVCFEGAQPPPMIECTDDTACPDGEFCDTAAATCTFECRTSEDCGGGATCSPRGQCLTDAPGGGCCGTSREPPVWVLGLLAMLAGRRLTSRRRSS